MTLQSVTALFGKHLTCVKGGEQKSVQIALKKRNFDSELEISYFNLPARI